MSIWQTYNAQFAQRNSDMPLLRRLLMMHVVARHELLRVSHSTFEQLSSAGYDVQTYDDGALPFDPKEKIHGALPKNWKIPQPTLIPKIAKLRETLLFMDGSALLPDGRYCYSDTHCINNRWRELQPETYKMLRIVDPVTDDALIRRLHLPSPVMIPGRCFSTRHGNEIGNFGHFVHDVLSRIYYEDLGAIVPGRDKVIAPPLRRPMEKKLFRMVFDGYEIVNVADNVPLKVDELLLPANLCNMQCFNTQAIAALAGRVRSLMVSYADKDKYKVCVSRSDGQRKNLGRSFANFEDYETRMRKLGYASVAVSKLDPEDQFALWSNTTDIVGIHGAGMMNMIMMPSEGNYTEIAGASGPNHRRTPCPNTTIRCAVAAGHQVCGINSVVDEQGRPMIDIAQLESVLSYASV